ncbi:PREDICTED: selenoprotein S [Pterocles gutturalis]|uniref:selenoprotein S n=1 Tax=Pterocles gutturalis TaxID=240206 RepID=UPI0005293B33|nr:PREDICTED: selenoprotein S [Pterocles gutturalis]
MADSSSDPHRQSLYLKNSQKEIQCWGIWTLSRTQDNCSDPQRTDRVTEGIAEEGLDQVKWFLKGCVREGLCPRVMGLRGKVQGAAEQESSWSLIVQGLREPPASNELWSEPELVVRRQEALAAARLRMQEELNAQAERYKEKQRRLEEEKRRQKIAMWESMQEGKSYKGNLKLNQQEVESGASTSSAVPKSKQNKKPLRGGGYNPLSGEGGGTCSWRPGRRGPSAGG